MPGLAPAVPAEGLHRSRPEFRSIPEKTVKPYAEAVGSDLWFCSNEEEPYAAIHATEAIASHGIEEGYGGCCGRLDKLRDVFVKNCIVHDRDAIPKAATFSQELPSHHVHPGVSRSELCEDSIGVRNYLVARFSTWPLCTFFHLKWEHQDEDSDESVMFTESFCYVQTVGNTAVLVPLEPLVPLQLDCGGFKIAEGLPFVVLEKPIVQIFSRKGTLLRIWTERLSSPDYGHADYDMQYGLGCVADEVAAVDADVWPAPAGPVVAGEPARQEEPQSTEHAAMRRFFDLARGKFDAENIKQHRCGWGGVEEDEPEDDSKAVEVMERDFALSASVRKVGQRSNKLRKGRKGIQRQRQNTKQQKTRAATRALVPAPGPEAALALVPAPGPEAAPALADKKKVNFGKRRQRGDCSELGIVDKTRHFISLEVKDDFAGWSLACPTCGFTKNIYHVKSQHFDCVEAQRRLAVWEVQCPGQTNL